MHFIGLDWGTSSLRAYLIDEQGKICQRVSSDQGLLAIKNNQFQQPLAEVLASLPGPGEYGERTAILAAGMVTSRNGWLETPYVTCPASVEALAGELTPLDTEQYGRIWFMPGLCQASPSPDIIRGEETQLAGLECPGKRVVIMPGTHSKWVRLVDGEVQQFSTYLTGDLFNAVRHHTILQAIPEGVWKMEDFKQGVKTGFDDYRRGRSLLSSLFQVRATTILATSTHTDSESYLSGLLMGTEIAEASATYYSSDTPYLIIANQRLTELYTAALSLCGLRGESAGEDIAAKGLFKIARAKQLI